MTLVKVAAGVPLAQARAIPSLLNPSAYTSGTASPPSATATGGAAHTKGSWTELIASAPEADGFELFVMSSTNTAGAVNGVLVDVGFGAAASEVVKIADIQCGARIGFAGATGAARVGVFPLRVPAGTRIAVRCQSTTASQAVGIGIRFFRSPVSRSSPAALVTMGTNAAASRGVIATAASNDVKGSYVEIVASTPQPFRGLIVLVGLQDTSGGNTTAALDIAIGASGSETVALPDLVLLGVSANEAISLDQPGFWPLHIPAGSRLSARFAATSITNLGSIDVSLIGVPA